MPGTLDAAVMRGAVPVPTKERAANRIDVRALCALLAVLATATAVIGLFAISPILLEAHGVAYMSSGGGILAKFHPATLAALAALGLRCLASRHPLRTAWRLASDDSGVVLMSGAIVLAGVFAALVSRTPVTPLVDTFALPILVFLLLRDLDATVLRWLALAVGLLLCANAVIALVEFLDGWRFIKVEVPDNVSADPTRGDTVFSWQAQLALDWRASALLGHPLENGLLVGAFILCLAAPGANWISPLVKIPVLLLQFASMFAFGARTALVFTILFSAWLLLQQTVLAIRGGLRAGPKQIALGLLLCGLAVGAIAVLAQTSFLDKTIARFADDAGSSTTRLTMFTLLDPLSWSDLMLGPDQGLVATWQRMYGLEFGIESSWLGLVLVYGLVVTAILIVGVAAFCRSVMRSCGRGTGLVLLLFLILVSVSASLSGKTPTFAMTIILAQVFLPGRSMRRARMSSPLEAA